MLLLEKPIYFDWNSDELLTGKAVSWPIKNQAVESEFHIHYRAQYIFDSQMIVTSAIRLMKRMAQQSSISSLCLKVKWNNYLCLDNWDFILMCELPCNSPLTIHKTITNIDILAEEEISQNSLFSNPRFLHNSTEGIVRVN